MMLCGCFAPSAGGRYSWQRRGLEKPPDANLMDTTVLRQTLSGRVVIACIGNEMRGDDGVGPFVAGLIAESESLRVVNCGETPENYLGVIAGFKPEKVVIIDAAHFGGQPGEIRTVRRSDIAGGGASTHDAILTMFSDYIERQTGAVTLFIAIQPEQTEVGRPMVPAVEAAGRELAAAINAITSGL
jgi:hydrogenase 3 maturation protease